MAPQRGSEIRDAAHTIHPQPSSVPYHGRRTAPSPGRLPLVAALLPGKVFLDVAFESVHSDSTVGGYGLGPFKDGPVCIYSWENPRPLLHPNQRGKHAVPCQEAMINKAANCLQRAHRLVGAMDASAAGAKTVAGSMTDVAIGCSGSSEVVTQSKVS